METKRGDKNHTKWLKINPNPLKDELSYNKCCHYRCENN
jgi:hypothetical protein